MQNNCPFCGANDTKVTLSNYLGYTVLSCNNCLAEFCSPFKAPDGEFYANANDVESSRRHSILSEWHRAHPSRKLPQLKHGENKNLLDVGCGNGDFAAFAVQRGFNVRGIDGDNASIACAKSRKLANAVFSCQTTDTLKEEHQKYDVITMFEVLEHLDKPLNALKDIMSLLKEGGYFIGSLPSENRYFAKKFNLNFAQPPYHLSFWTADTWAHFVKEKLGFEVISCESNTYYGYLCNIAYEKCASALSISNSFLKKLLYAFFFIPKQLEIAIEKINGKSSSFLFVLQKKHSELS